MQHVEVSVPTITRDEASVTVYDDDHNQIIREWKCDATTGGWYVPSGNERSFVRDESRCASLDSLLLAAFDLL